MTTEPKYPWRLDTNDRYRETVTTILGLSTAALLLPVFLAREFLGIKGDVALKNVFTSAIYWSWGLFGFSIFSAVVFCFLSARWARLAWGQPVGVFGINVSGGVPVLPEASRRHHGLVRVRAVQIVRTRGERCRHVSACRTSDSREFVAIQNRPSRTTSRP